jgi:hypothetical protein
MKYEYALAHRLAANQLDGKMITLHHTPANPNDINAQGILL